MVNAGSCWVVAHAQTASGRNNCERQQTGQRPLSHSAHLLEQGVHGPQHPRHLPDSRSHLEHLLQQPQKSLEQQMICSAGSAGSLSWQEQACVAFDGCTEGPRSTRTSLGSRHRPSVSHMMPGRKHQRPRMVVQYTSDAASLRNPSHAPSLLYTSISTCTDHAHSSATACLPGRVACPLHRCPAYTTAH